MLDHLSVLSYARANRIRSAFTQMYVHPSPQPSQNGCRSILRPDPLTAASTQPLCPASAALVWPLTSLAGGRRRSEVPCPEFDNNNQGQSDTHIMTGLDNEQPPDGRFAGEWQPLEHGLSDLVRCPFKKRHNPIGFLCSCTFLLWPRCSFVCRELVQGSMTFLPPLFCVRVFGYVWERVYIIDLYLSLWVILMAKFMFSVCQLKVASQVPFISTFICSFFAHPYFFASIFNPFLTHNVVYVIQRKCCF